MSGGQRCFYMLPDGSISKSKTGAHRVAPQLVADLARKLETGIPPQFFVATAERETNFATNEIDVEEDGFTSQGLFQICNGRWYNPDTNSWSYGGRAECTVATDLLDPAVAVNTFNIIQTLRLRNIQTAAAQKGNFTGVDVWAYLGLAHNEGLEAALKTIKNYGLDWLAYKQRNGVCAFHLQGNSLWTMPCDPNKPCTDYGKKIGRYGDSMITGGTRWIEVK